MTAPNFNWARDIFHMEDLGSVAGLVDDPLLESGSVQRLEGMVLYHRNGRTIPVVMGLKLLPRRGDWDQDRYLATIFDLTEYKEKEAELAEQKAYWKRFFDISPAGVIVYDADGRYHEASPAACQMTGYSREELLSPTFDWKDLFAPSLDDALRAVEKAAGSEQSVTAELIMKNKGDEFVHVRCTMIKLPHEMGATEVKFLAFNVDITELKEKEVALNRMIQTQRSAIESIGVRLTQLASGDLATAVPDGLEGEMKQLGVDLAMALSTMRETLDQVRQAAFDTRHNMLELEQGNTNLSQRTQRQAAAVEEIGAAMEELAASVNQSAGQSEVSTTRAVEVKGHAEKGAGLIYAAEEKMRAIDEAAKTMSDIIEVVNGIAFTTNILALNAAVEAARAGEHGRGFAVVAQEVRRLSQSSAENAKDIKRLIDGIVQLVGEGNALSSKGSGSFAEILEGMNEVSQRVADMAFAMESQRTATDQVASAVMEVSVLTQENSALVQENSTAFATLGDQADHLNDRVRAFKLDIED